MDIPFRKSFLEIALISLVTVALTFDIGFLIRTFLVID